MSNQSQTVPNTGLVTFGKFDVTAGSEDAAISSIQLERQGLSDRTDISRVYFEQNSKRVSSRGSVNIDNEITVSFTPAMVVKAGTTETIDLVVELNDGSDVGAEHRFAIVDVESSTDVANNLPVVTNTMKLGSYTVEEVAFDPTVNGGNPELNVGDNDVLIGEFQLRTTGDRDNLFKSVTFRNNGGADLNNVLANVGLYNNGENVATEVMIEGREITFIVNDEIENGRTENYEIRADVVSLERLEDKIELELRNNTDLNVVEVRTSFSAPITFFGNNDTMTEYTLVGGELLLSRDSQYTNTDTVSSSTNDVVLLSSNLRVDEAITVEDLVMNYETNEDGDSLFEQYRDLKLVVDGRTVATYTPNEDNDNGNTGTIEFDGTFLVQSDSNIKVLGNLQNSVADNSTFEIVDFSLSVENNTAWDIRYVSNDERVDDIAGTVQGIKVTVAEASLLITKNDGLNDETLVSGAKDVELFGFSMRANDVSDIKVTSLRPTANLGGGLELANITNIRLYEGSTLLKTENDFDFNSLNITIPKNSAKSFRIVADFDNSVEDNATITLSLDDSSEVSARNDQSNKLLENTSIDGVDSTEFTFAGEGELLVNNNSSSRDATIVSPSDSETDVFTFDLEARDDDLRLTDLYVNNANSGSVTTESTATLTINGGATTSSGIDVTVLGKTFSIITLEELQEATESTATEDLSKTFTGVTGSNFADDYGSRILITTANDSFIFTHNAATYAELATNLATEYDFITASGSEVTFTFDNWVNQNVTIESVEWSADYSIQTTWGVAEVTAETNAETIRAYLDADGDLTATRNGTVITVTREGNYETTTTVDTGDTGLNVSTTNGNATSTAVSALDLNDSVKSASIRVDGRVIEGAIVSANTLYFPIGTANPIILERDEVVSVDVNLAFNDSNTRTNKQFSLRIGSADYTGTVNGTVNGMRLVSDSTGQEIKDIDVSGVESETHLLARSKPTVSRLSESDSTIAYKFTVTADANRKVDLEKLEFNVRGVAQSGALFTLRKEGSSAIVSNKSVDLSKDGSTFSFISSELSKDDEITSGTTTTYVLEIWGVDTTAGGANDESTREVELTDLVYQDDVNNPEDISVESYNILPTTATTHKY